MCNLLWKALENNIKWIDCHEVKQLQRMLIVEYIYVAGIWMFAVWFFQLLYVFEIIHNKRLGENKF